MPTPDNITSFSQKAAISAGFLILATMLFMLVRNQPVTDPALFLALRLLLSLCAAILGATLPGFLDIKGKLMGFSVRAGGAMALFLLSYTFTPDLPGMKQDGPATVTQSSTGDASPPIVGNSGSVTINAPTLDGMPKEGNPINAEPVTREP